MLIVFVFFIFYEVYLKKLLLVIIKNNPDATDRVYYGGIFNNLEYPIITSILILFLLLKFRVRILRAITNLLALTNLLWIVLGIVFILQLLLILLVKDVSFSDSIYYISIAERLYQFGSYLSEQGFKTAYWPIGLPAILAVIRTISRDNILIMKVLNILIYLSLVFVTYKLFSGKLSKLSGVIFLISFAFFPANLFSSNFILTEYPFTLILWIIILLTIKYPLKYAFFLGFLTAVLSYLRPLGLVIPFVIILYYIKYFGLKASFNYSAKILIVFVLLLGPWAVRNYQVFKSFVPVSTNGGINFLMGNHSNSDGTVNFNFEYDFYNPDEAEESNKAYRKGVNDIWSEPGLAVVRCIKKIFYSYFRTDTSIAWALKKSEYNLPSIISSYTFYFINFIYYIIIAISFLSIINIIRAGRTQFHNLLLIVFSLFIFLIVIYVGGEKYLIPILPVHFYFFAEYFNQKNYQLI
jgi:hypothetical protein